MEVVSSPSRDCASMLLLEAYAWIISSPEPGQHRCVESLFLRIGCMRCTRCGLQLLIRLLQFQIDDCFIANTVLLDLARDRRGKIVYEFPVSRDFEMSQFVLTKGSQVFFRCF